MAIHYFRYGDKSGKLQDTSMDVPRGDTAWTQTNPLRLLTCQKRV